MAVLKRYNSTTSLWEPVLIGEPGPAGEFLNTYFGAWSDGAYDAGTIVTHLGSSWIAVQAASTGDEPAFIPPDPVVWEPIAIGAEGGGSPLGPLGFENLTGTWDSGEGASMVFIDDPTILNEKIVTAEAAATHETDPVIVQIDYGLGDLGDRFEIISGSPLTISYYINDVPDPMEATNILGPVGYLPTVPAYCLATLTKIQHAQETEILEETFMMDGWLISAGQLELDV